MIPRIAGIFLCAVFSAHAGTKAPVPMNSAPDNFGFHVTLDSGYLWKTGGNSAHDYEAVPTLVSLLTPEMFSLWDGKISVRNRFTLIHEAYTSGPEDYYFGAAAAPSLEYEIDRFTTAFLAVGGGAGWINSSGGAEGQGQDLAFNWFAHAGLRRQVFESLELSTGAYFTHHSNRGMTDPNPGIDLLGFTVGLGWRF
ncbi:MAG: acyloxyacyl hydrolase [Verrucomicrobiota bacterium]